MYISVKVPLQLRYRIFPMGLVVFIFIFLGLFDSISLYGYTSLLNQSSVDEHLSADTKSSLINNLFHTAFPM